ncbi:MAG: PEP-CTERM sorting domain-containing protein [Deferrisomatales bacterium]
MKHLLTLSALILAMVATNSKANAVLIAYDGGLVYDTDLNITWYDAPQIAMNWYDSMAWAQGLNVGGVAGWRLPATPGTTYDYTNEGEMGHLYYDELLNASGQVSGNSITNKGPFTHLGPGVYFSATEVPLFPDNVWYFNFGGRAGNQHVNYKWSLGYALAVHDGNLGTPSPEPVPEPTTVLLLGSGLVCLVCKRSRGRRK